MGWNEFSWVGAPIDGFSKGCRKSANWWPLWFWQLKKIHHTIVINNVTAIIDPLNDLPIYHDNNRVLKKRNLNITYIFWLKIDPYLPSLSPGSTGVDPAQLHHCRKMSMYCIELWHEQFYCIVLYCCENILLYCIVWYWNDLLHVQLLLEFYVLNPLISVCGSHFVAYRHLFCDQFTSQPMRIISEGALVKSRIKHKQNFTSAGFLSQSYQQCFIKP